MNQIYHYCEVRATESIAFFLDTLFEVSHNLALPLSSNLAAPSGHH